MRLDQRVLLRKKLQLHQSAKILMTKVMTAIKLLVAYGLKDLELLDLARLPQRLLLLSMLLQTAKLTTTMLQAALHPLNASGFKV